MKSTPAFAPYREPLFVTVRRNLGISIIAGGVIAQFSGGWSRWPVATVAVFWPSFGGHWVDMFFLNWLRMRVPTERVAQIASRLALWFVGGIVLGLGMALTTASLAYYPRSRWPAWWQAGLGFVGVQLLAHLALQLRRRPSFYNGRG